MLGPIQAEMAVAAASLHVRASPIATMAHGQMPAAKAAARHAISQQAIQMPTKVVAPIQAAMAAGEVKQDSPLPKEAGFFDETG